MIVGLGTDIVEVERIRRLVRSEAFLRKVFTEGERRYCDGKADPALSYAARFAAKEAVAKALGTGFGEHCALLDVEVVLSESGVPGVALSGAAAGRAHVMGIADWLLSLSHTDGMAIATALAQSRTVS